MSTVAYDRLLEEYTNGDACGPEGHEYLLRYVQPRAHLIFQELTIVRDTRTDPYDNAAQLNEDVYAGILRLGPTPAEDETGHPYWSTTDFHDYRAWHDIYGHHELGAGFDRFGELTVLRAHCKSLHSARRRLTVDQANLAICAVANEVLYRVACGVMGCADLEHRPIAIGPYMASLIDSMLAW